MKSMILVLTLALSLSVFAGDKAIDATVNLSPTGSFQVQADKIKGKLTKKGDGYVAKKLWVNAKKLETGIEVRDDHMKKRLNVKKHKNIVVSDIKAKGGKGIGKISINGITKKIKFNYTTSGKTLTAKFKVSLKQHQVKDLKYLGVGAKDIVEVVANVPIK